MKISLFVVYESRESELATKAFLRLLIVFAFLTLSVSARSAELDEASLSSFHIPHVHDGWHSVRPAPPTILAIMAAHAASHSIYIGSLGGRVIKSRDGGITFREVNNGLVGKTIAGLAGSPANPNIASVAQVEVIGVVNDAIEDRIGHPVGFSTGRKATAYTFFTSCAARDSCAPVPSASGVNGEMVGRVGASTAS